MGQTTSRAEPDHLVGLFVLESIVADEIAAVIDSAPVAETATGDPGSAVEQSDVTHGGDAEQTTSTETVEAESSDDPESDPETEPSETDTPEEAKTKAQKRRERREARDQKRIDDAVAATLARQEQERQAAETAKAREAEAIKAAEAEAKALAEFLGEPGEADQKRAALDEVNRKIRDELENPAGADLDALAQEAKTLEGRLSEIDKNGRYKGRIENQVWDQIKGHFLSPLAYPEIANNPEAKRAYLAAEGGMSGSLSVLAQAIRAAKDVERDAAIKALTEKHETQTKAMTAELGQMRIRAGGAEVADMAPGGSPLSAPGAMTRSQFMALPKDQKDRIRQNPALLAEIYNRSA